MSKANINNRYAGIDFPEYKFVEFPKAVTHNGKTYVVNDAEEEKALKATVRDYRKEALQRAAELKLEIPDDWKLEKIQLYIKKIESDLEFEKLMKEEVTPAGNKDESKTSLQNKLTLNRNLNK
jgi:hypothetical protein